MAATAWKVGLAGALSAVGAATAWDRLIRRPLPRTSGTLRVPGLEASLEIGRDRFGVPRLRASGALDLAFGQGFCHGQDRLWQIELYRRFAAGRISEFAGKEGLKLDRLVRTLGLRRAAERDLARVTARERAYLEAYGAGVDAAVAAARALPFEMQLLGLEPEPWSPADSLAVGKVLALGFSTNMETELFRAELVRKVGAERAGRLEPAYPAGNPLVLGGGWAGDGLALAEQIAAVREALGVGLQPAASNNWVVSGERSVTGRPLMGADPHITTSMPGLFYQMELQAPGMELNGASVPAFPGIVTGHSRHLAWSFTNAMADIQDLFVERLEGGRYEFRGEWRELTVHREEIRIRGRRPESLEVQETHHGPVLTGPLGAESAEPLSLAWTALREPAFFTGLSLEGGGIETGEELIARFDAYATPLNLLWADAAGNIGYKLVGKLPRRRGGCPDLPKPGWSGEHEWEGYVPYEELPAVVNPPRGVLFTANNAIAPEDYPHHITSEYLDGFRAARIEQLLEERERHSLDDFERMQADLYSIPGGITADRLCRLRPDDEREREALEQLRRWDRRMSPDSVGATIYKLFIVHFARAVSEAAIGDSEYAARWRSKSLVGFMPMTSSPWRFHAHLLDLWEEGEEELIGGSWDRLAHESLTAAVEELRTHDDWRWGKIHGAHFPHALGEGGTVVSRIFDRLLSRRLDAGGAQETVCQVGFVPHDGDYTGRWAPAYRLLADVGDPDRSRWQHMTGQSGHPGSRHYDDLLEPWLAGRTQPVRQPPLATLELEPA